MNLSNTLTLAADGQSWYESLQEQLDSEISQTTVILVFATAFALIGFIPIYRRETGIGGTVVGHLLETYFLVAAGAMLVYAIIDLDVPPQTGYVGAFTCIGIGGYMVWHRHFAHGGIVFGAGALAFILLLLSETNPFLARATLLLPAGVLFVYFVASLREPI